MTSNQRSYSTDSRNETAEIKIAIVTNMPAPYVVPIHRQISNMPGIKLRVFYCCKREPDRQWNLPPLDFDHEFLHERFVMIRQRGAHHNLDVTAGGRCIHNNPDVVSSLRRFAPNVIVTVGFNPTYLYAFAYALLKGIPHVPMTDGTFSFEKNLSWVHSIVRRFVYARSLAFASASLGGRKIYESYGIAPERCFQSCLCIDNDAFEPRPEPEEKRFDFIFCGQIERRKNPLFALEVALAVAARLGRKVNILFVGTGSLEQQLRQTAAQQAERIEVAFAGFSTQQALPALYHSARIFLFPTHSDVWGVVANEACAAGLPVIVSPHAGAAGELILDGENGFVCDLNCKLWVARAVLLLTRNEVYRKFSERSRALSQEYTFDKAAAGLVAACRYALSEDHRGQR